MLQNFSTKALFHHQVSLSSRQIVRTMHPTNHKKYGEFMKKLALLAAAIFTTSAAQASIYDIEQSTNQWYWQADIGYSDLNFDFGDAERDEDGVGGRISVGKDKGSYRYAYDYSYFGNAEDNYHWRSGTTYVRDEYDTYAHSIGASVFYDFKNTSRVTPYVGARVGVNFLSQDLRRCVSSVGLGSVCGYSDDTNTDTRVGVGGIVGATYQATPTLAVNVSGEYNYLGKVGDTKVTQTGANVGVRMNF